MEYDVWTTVKEQRSLVGNDKLVTFTQSRSLLLAPLAIQNRTLNKSRSGIKPLGIEIIGELIKFHWAMRFKIKVIGQLNITIIETAHESLKYILNLLQITNPDLLLSYARLVRAL